MCALVLPPSKIPPVQGNDQIEDFLLPLLSFELISIVTHFVIALPSLLDPCRWPSSSSISSVFLPNRHHPE